MQINWKKSVYFEVKRPEYNFRKLTKVGYRADNGDKDIAQMHKERSAH